MSRIGKKPVTVPANVKVAIKNNVVSVTGPQGVIDVPFKPKTVVVWDEKSRELRVANAEGTAAGDAEAAALWGTARALIANAVTGVEKGYERTMEVVGVGWTASIVGKQLKLVIGYANPVLMDIPKDLKVVVDKQIVRISGPDKKSVGQFAADMRAHRKPEPYNGKGIKYTDEVIKKKSGKAFGTA